MNSPGIQILERKSGTVGLTVFTIFISSTAVEIHSQTWSTWERDNAISRHGAFMVIMQPEEGYCYAKQSYHNDPDSMELMFQDGFPIVITPFFTSADDEVEYWVDDDSRRTVPNSLLGKSSSFRLSTDVVNEMKAGRILHVSYKPEEFLARTQSFSLFGFEAATQVLAGARCQDADNTGIEADATDSYTPGSIIYIRSPITLKPFPDEDSLGLEEVKSGLRLMYIQEQDGWLEFRAIGSGGQTGWILESTFSGKTPIMVVKAIEDDAYRGFQIGFWKYSRSLERPGYKPFEDVVFMGDGIIKVIATDDWLDQPRPERDRQLDSVFQLWAVADDSGLPIAVYVYDRTDQVRMRRD